MVYIRVEIWPRGDRSKARLLGEGFIANVGMNQTKTRGWYKASFRGKRDVYLRGADVANFPRKQLLAWDLLLRALTAAFGARNQ